MAQKISPDSIVHDGGRQLVSGYYESLYSQLRRADECIVALLCTDEGLETVSIPDQTTIEELRIQNACIEGFFAIPKA